jgi:hypothetical protein
MVYYLDGAVPSARIAVTGAHQGSFSSSVAVSGEKLSRPAISATPRAMPLQSRTGFINLMATLPDA